MMSLYKICMRMGWPMLVVFLASSVAVYSAPKKPASAPTGKFEVSEGMNRDYSVLEMRDGEEKLWPMIWVAHPKGQGNVSIEDNELEGLVTSGTFTLFGAGADVQLIEGRRQAKRLGGGLAKEEAYTDKKGNEGIRRVGPDLVLKVDLKGPKSAVATIGFNGKAVRADAVIEIRPAQPQGKGGLDISGSCKTSAGALGLEGNGPVTIIFRTPGRP